jgi:L-threonylcarbamoyladenylate synthase
MIVLKVDANNPDVAAIRMAADAITRGELVVFPTETVYGLAADALNDTAVGRVFEAKGRVGTHPLPVQIAKARYLHLIASNVPESAQSLADKYWPGPLTIVLKKSDFVSDTVSGGLETVGVRVPDHAVALALLRESGLPIVATSANLTGNDAPTCAQSAIDQLGESVSVVLDAGVCEIGVASTVVDMSVVPVRVLRVGAISVEQIAQIVGDVEVNE